MNGVVTCCPQLSFQHEAKKNTTAKLILEIKKRLQTIEIQNNEK
jgi:hypothetical protein